MSAIIDQVNLTLKIDIKYRNAHYLRNTEFDFIVKFIHNKSVKYTIYLFSMSRKYVKILHGPKPNIYVIFIYKILLLLMDIISILSLIFATYVKREKQKKVF